MNCIIGLIGRAEVALSWVIMNQLEAQCMKIPARIGLPSLRHPGLGLLAPASHLGPGLAFLWLPTGTLDLSWLLSGQEGRRE